MFELTRSQKEIRKAAREFAKGEFDKDQAIELEKANRFPEAIWKKAADLGFIGIHFPESLSGGGLGLVENCLLAEEFCRISWIVMNSYPRRLCYPRGNFSVTPAIFRKNCRGSLGHAFALGSRAVWDPIKPAFALTLSGGFLSRLS